MTQTDSDQSLPTDNTGLCHGDIHMAKEWQLYLVGAGTKPFSMGDVTFTHSSSLIQPMMDMQQ